MLLLSFTAYITPRRAHRDWRGQTFARCTEGGRADLSLVTKCPGEQSPEPREEPWHPAPQHGFIGRQISAEKEKILSFLGGAWRSRSLPAAAAAPFCCRDFLGAVSHKAELERLFWSCFTQRPRTRAAKRAGRCLQRALHQPLSCHSLWGILECKGGSAPDPNPGIPAPRNAQHSQRHPSRPSLGKISGICGCQTWPQV